MTHDTSKPAFPHKYSNGGWHEPGMTLRQYAAIKLRAPNSGTEWLDDMIRQAKRDEFAGQAMDALMNTVEEDDQVAASQDLPTVCRAFSKQAYEIADAMLKQREGE